MRADVVIIGAGASGLMCAMEAGRRGRSVIVVDHRDQVGSKIRISGGGRCNFTNRQVSREHYLSENPHFVTSALSRFTPEDFIALLEQNGIRYVEREAGQLFCAGSATEIIDLFERECRRASVAFMLGCTVREVRKADWFELGTSRGNLKAKSLVVATGGLSYPQLGATSFGHRLARQFGLRITPLRPALTPVRFSPEDATAFASLSGISLEAEVSHGTARFSGSILFTHRGLSGPAVLQISSYWDRKTPIAVDLLPGRDIGPTLLEKRRGKMYLATVLSQFLPTRFVKAWCERYAPSRPLHRISPQELEAVASRLHDWQVQPRDTEGFNKAEVTLGGVDTRELSSRTMESHKVPGLFFIGELVDVTGWLGGYNLHWAWASGSAAAEGF